MTVAICSLLVVIVRPLLPLVDLANIVMLFLLAVFLISAYLGRGPGIVAAFLSVLLFDFFCVPPHFSLAVNDVQYVMTFAVMLAVALITGQLAANLKAQALQSQEEANRNHALYEMAKTLSGAMKLSQVNDTVRAFLREFAQMESVLLVPQEQADSGEQLVPLSEHHVWFEPNMAWAAYEQTKEAMLSEPDGLYYLPLVGTTRPRGVLVLSHALHHHGSEDDQASVSLSPERQHLLRAVASLITIAIERLHYADVAQTTETQMATERLRSSILSALSHDLRTPLTVLVGMADAMLASKPVLSNAQQEIATTIRERARSLSGMVTNLLEMARLQSGNLVLHQEWQPIEEVIGASIHMLGHALSKHRLHVMLPEDLPMLNIDAVLIERVFCNLLENAAKYAPELTSITITASAHNKHVEVSVEDQGTGFVPEHRTAVFTMFVRSPQAHSTSGTGIGLAVCKAIIEAHGGTISATNSPLGGGRVMFTLPRGEPPVLDPELLEGLMHQGVAQDSDQSSESADEDIRAEETK